MRYCLILLFTLSLSSLYSQYTKTYKVMVDTFSTGQVFQYKTVRKKQTREFKLHEFYLKEDVRHILFFPSGQKWMEVQRVTKKGTYGRYCFELKFEQKEYYPNGQLKSREINSCDCYRVKKYLYDENGKRIGTEREKNRWIKKKME